MPTNYSACVRIQVLNFSRDKIFVVNVQPAKFFNLKNFRLYDISVGRPFKPALTVRSAKRQINRHHKRRDARSLSASVRLT